MTATISIAKVYLRSIVGIVSTSAGIVAYGMFVAPVGDNVLLGSSISLTSRKAL